MFEKIPLDQLVVDATQSFDDHPYDNQLFLFSNLPDRCE